MPLDQGYTVEEQVTGAAVSRIGSLIGLFFTPFKDKGGLQIEVYNLYPETVQFQHPTVKLKNLYWTPRQHRLKSGERVRMIDKSMSVQIFKPAHTTHVLQHSV